MGRGKNKNKPRTRADTARQTGVFWFNDNEFDELFKDGGYIRFDRHPDVKTCVKKIADLISSMTIFFMKNTELGDVRVKNGFSRVLDIQPNRYMTRKTLIYKIVEEMLITGNSALLPSFDGDMLNELRPIPAENISYRTLDDGGYYADISGTPFTDDEIIHFVHNPSMEEPWRGDGLRVYLREILQNLNDAQKIKGDFYTKHYKPSVAFMFNADSADFTSSESRTEIFEKWVRTKPGEPYIIPQQIIEMKHFPAMSLKDIAVNESVELDKKTIAKIFGVPLFMVGLGSFDRVEFNNFIDTVILPIVKSIEQELTRKLVWSDDHYIMFNLESLKAFDLEARINMMYQGKALGVFSANEIRVQSGYETVDRPEMNEYTTLENYLPADRLGDQKKLKQESDTDDSA